MKTRIWQGERSMGKFTCNGRKMTRFQSFKKKVGSFGKRLVVMGAIMSAMGWSVAFGSNYVPRTVYASVDVDNSDSVISAKLGLLKMGVVKDIESCESGGKDGLIVFDTNRKASLGVMQFQVATVIHYYKAIYGQDISEKDAEMVALDAAKAEALAQDVMFKTKNMAGKDWVNCSAKFDSDQKIRDIEDLAD